MSALITAPRWIAGAGSPSTRPYLLRGARDVL